jgi:hypothetical protein
MGGNKVIISGRAFAEIVEYIEDGGAEEPVEEAFQELNSLSIDIEVVEKEKSDDKRGRELINKYDDTDYEFTLHYPDSTILAHYKREAIDLLVTRDRDLRMSAQHEGIDTEKMPTVTEIADRKFESLF